MNTTRNKNDQVNIIKDSYRWIEVPDAESPLLIPDGQPTCEIKEHRDLVLDLIPVNLLGHLPSPVGVSSKLESRVRPLFAGLDPTEGEIHCHNDAINSPTVNQPQELPHLLHPVGAGPLRPLGIAHWDLVYITRNKRLHLPDIKPFRSPVLHICVERAAMY